MLIRKYNKSFNIFKKCHGLLYIRTNVKGPSRNRRDLTRIGGCVLDYCEVVGEESNVKSIDIM